MAANRSSTKYFLLLFVGGCVMLAGVGTFFAAHDQDWQYTYERQSSDPPGRHAGSVADYDALRPEQKTVVDRALAGESRSYETDANLPPGVVKRNGTYYVFNRFTTFDWTHPGTGGPVGVAFLGVGMVVEAVRRDVKYG